MFRTLIVSCFVLYLASIAVHAKDTNDNMLRGGESTPVENEPHKSFLQQFSGFLMRPFRPRDQRESESATAVEESSDVTTPQQTPEDDEAAQRNLLQRFLDWLRMLFQRLFAFRKNNPSEEAEKTDWRVTRTNK